MKKAIVTGGAGFIGSNLTDALLERGFEVVVLDDLSAGKKENINPKAQFLNVDIKEIDAMREAFEGAELVFHLSAMPRVQYSIENPLETHEANVTGTLNVLKLSAEYGVKKLIFSSSSAVYGDGVGKPMKESDSPSPKSPYALQKYITEEYCKLWSLIYDLPTVSLRYFNVYGERQDPEGAYALVIGKFLKQRMEGEKLTVTGDGEQSRGFVHVGDVVEANIIAAESKLGSGEVINIGSGESVSINRIAELVGGEKEYVESRFEPKHTLAKISKARDLLGWTPKVSIEEGMERLKESHGLE